MMAQQVMDALAGLAADASIIAVTILVSYVTLYALHHLRSDVFSDRLKRGVSWLRGR